MNRDLASEFKDLVKDVITPRLKTFGYRKKNLNYNRQFDLLIQCIKVQKSQWNHHDRISFTTNYGCFNELVYRLSRNRTELLPLTIFQAEYTLFALALSGIRLGNCK